MKFGLSDILEKAQKFQSEFKASQEKLAAITVEASSGGGLVKVVANGKQQIVSVSIDPELFKMNDLKMLEDLVLSATNSALSLVQQKAADELKQFTSGFGLEGALGSLFKS